MERNQFPFLNNNHILYMLYVHNLIYYLQQKYNKYQGNYIIKTIYYNQLK